MKLGKHELDIDSLLNNDVICLTETQIDAV